MTPSVRPICIAIVVSVAASLGIALLTAMAAATPAHATCESIITVQSRELDFCYNDWTPLDGDAFPPSVRRLHFRALAHGIAVAQACLDTASEYSCEAGTPPRTRIRLVAASDVEAVDSSDVNAYWLVRRCRGADADSACVLWSCELKRFRTRKAAANSYSVAATSVPESLAYAFDRKVGPRIRWVTCGGIFEPGSYVARIPGATSRPWALRLGLYFTRDEAVRAARVWREELGGAIRIVRQRVDGALLEQALLEPEDGC